MNEPNGDPTLPAARNVRHQIKAIVGPSLGELLEQTAGLRRADLLAVLREIVHTAKRHYVAVHDGKITDVLEVPDRGTQLRAIAEIHALKGEYPAKKLDISGQMRMEQVIGHLDVLAQLGPNELRQLLAGDSPPAGDIIDADPATDRVD